MHLDRRRFLRLGVASTVALPFLDRPRPVLAVNTPSATPDEALQRLMDGNARFVSGNMTWPNQSASRRSGLTSGQAPYAAILGCADSRVPPEVVFDEGLGDLFVVRVAGNAPNPELIASIEYGVAVLGASLVMVLGHTSCGAVGAAIKSVDTGTPLPTNHLQSLVDDLALAVTAVHGQPGDLQANATIRNVQLGVKKLSSLDPILGSGIADGTVKIVGGMYDLASGKISIVPALPA